MPDVREYQSVVEEAEQAARAGDFARADLRLRDALRLQETSLGADHPDLASTLNNLAVVCETLGQFDDAELFYRRAYAIASGSLPPGDPSPPLAASSAATSAPRARASASSRAAHATATPTATDDTFDSPYR